MIYLRLRKIVVQRVTVVKFGIDTTVQSAIVLAVFESK